MIFHFLRPEIISIETKAFQGKYQKCCPTDKIVALSKMKQVGKKEKSIKVGIDQLVPVWENKRTE